VADPQTVGAYLRAARTEQRISLERAAQDTKIKEDFIMRMESDEFDFIAPAYARGFLRSYSRFLGLDDYPLLEDFDRRFGTKPVESVQLVAQDRNKTKPVKEHSALSRWPILLVLGAGVLLLLALIGIFAPKPARDREPRREGIVATESPSPDSSGKPDDKKKKDKASPPPGGQDVFADGIELIVEVVEGESWIEIDADGEDVFAEIIEAGGAETFTADEEMTVILGAPSVVQVTLNGQSYGTIPTSEPGALNLAIPEDIGTVVPFPSASPTPSPSPSPTDATP
jgi:cytoskeleton protein RodZ